MGTCRPNPANAASSACTRSAKEVGKIEINRLRHTSQCFFQMRAIVACEFPRHRRCSIRIGPKIEDGIAQIGVCYAVSALPCRGDCLLRPAIAMLCTVAFQRSEPGLGGELIKAGRA